MAKAYENMKENENLDWCKPYIDEEGNVISINYEMLYSPLEIYRRNAIAHSKGLNMTKEEVLEMIREEKLKETGCCNCPFRDECEAMDLNEDV